MIALVKNKNSFLIVLTIFSATLFFMSCKKKDTPAPPFIISGSWQLRHYAVGTVDKTSDFTGYSFVFNDDSSFVAEHNGISEVGTWSYNSGALLFEITIGATIPLTQISKTWLLILKSDSELILDEDNIVNDEELHFLKN